MQRDVIVLRFGVVELFDRNNVYPRSISDDNAVRILPWRLRRIFQLARAYDKGMRSPIRRRTRSKAVRKRP